MAPKQIACSQPPNNIIENVIAGVIVAAIVWLTARARTRWHRKENTD